jgi:predicted peroxiredoxin
VSGKAVISLTTGLEDPEKVTVAFLVAVAAAEQQRPTLMFLTKEAVRLATAGVVQGVACEGCPPLPELAKRYTEAGGRLLVCPICFNARHLAEDALWRTPRASSWSTSTSRPVRSAGRAGLRVAGWPAADSTASAAPESSRPARASARSWAAASPAERAGRCGRGSVRDR